MKKLKFDVFNNGLLEFGDLVESVDENLNALDEKEFTVKGRLFFNYMSIRQEDKLKFDDTGFKLTLKIKTPYIDKLVSSHIIKINGQYYSILKIDPSLEQSCLYLYLSELNDILDKHIEIYVKQDVGVLEDKVWNFYRRVWANIIDMKADEDLVNDNIGMSINKCFTIRFIEELNPGINKKASVEYMIKYLNKDYNIKNIINVDEENKLLKITAIAR